MSGQFAQFRRREEYVEFLDLKPDEITYGPEPIKRYNVALGTKELRLNDREGELHLDPVFWIYGHEWWDKQSLVKQRARV